MQYFMEQLNESASVGVAVVGNDDSQRRCGKRQSQSSSSQLGISSNSCDAELEPRAKKTTLHNPNNESSLGSEFELNGYSKLDLPIDLSVAMNLKAHSLDSQPPGVMPNNQAGVVSNNCSPAGGMSPGAGLPPPGTNRLSNDVGTPTKCPTDCVTGQSSDSLRLKRIKETVKEMARMCGDIISEEDETPDEENQNASAATGTGTAANASQDMDDKEHEEQIRAEMVGDAETGPAANASQDTVDKEHFEQIEIEKVGDDGLKINLRCPCGSGYELLMTGKCLYHKKTTIDLSVAMNLKAHSLDSQPPGVMPKNQAGVVSNDCSPAGGMSPGAGLPPPGTNRLSNDVGTPTKCPTDCVTGHSPDSLRLKRIQETVKEMARLCGDIISEEDETPDEENQNASAETGTGTAANASQDMDDKEHEEQIRVEMVGDDGLKIKLPCPCGCEYELLITGKCFYNKLL